MDLTISTDTHRYTPHTIRLSADGERTLCEQCWGFGITSEGYAVVRETSCDGTLSSTLDTVVCEDCAEALTESPWLNVTRLGYLCADASTGCNRLVQEACGVDSWCGDCTSAALTDVKPCGEPDCKGVTVHYAGRYVGHVLVRNRRGGAWGVAGRTCSGGSIGSAHGMVRVSRTDDMHTLCNLLVAYLISFVK